MAAAQATAHETLKENGVTIVTPTAETDALATMMDHEDEAARYDVDQCEQAEADRDQADSLRHEGIGDTNATAASDDPA